MDIYKEIKKLREQNVFITFIPEYYDDGVNYNFQIRFFEDKFTTMSYGDNHEYGEVEDVIVASIKFANFMLSKPEYLKYYFFRFDDSKSREENTKEYLYSNKIKEEIHSFIYTKLIKK